METATQGTATDLRQALELLWSQLGSTSPITRETPDPTPAEGPDPYGNDDPDWLRVDWTEHLRRAEVGAADATTTVNYVEMGPDAPSDTPDLVLVHGLSGCWQNWLETIPALAARRRVIAPDLPGFGHSPMPPWEISVEGYGGFLRDFCDRIGVGDDAVLVGNSLGGFISAEAVIADGKRFGKLALVSAAGISSARIRREPAVIAARLAVGLAPLALSMQERAMRRPKLRHSTFGTVYHRPEDLRAELLYEQYANGSGRPGFVPAVMAVSGYSFIDRLGEVETPTLIVWGRNDRIVPAVDANGYSGALRNSSTVIFDETGHGPMLERPTRFNRLLEAFLEPGEGRAD